MAKVVPVCSSSKGNSIFIGDTSSGVLVDAGCSFKALKDGLALCGIPFEAVKAVLITHEHIDHTKALGQITKRTSLPVYASDGTTRKLFEDNLVAPGAVIHSLSEIGSAPVDMDIDFFHTPHDAAESVGYTVKFKEHKVACCTDLGYVTDEVKRNLIGCDTAYIEANYDPKLLSVNPKYPPYLKTRISGDRGHLSNMSSAELCTELVKSGARRQILGHLSQENNTPKIAYNAVEQKLNGCGVKCGVDCTLDVAPVVTQGKYIII